MEAYRPTCCHREQAKKPQWPHNGPAVGTGKTGSKAGSSLFQSGPSRWPRLSPSCTKAFSIKGGPTHWPRLSPSCTPMCRLSFRPTSEVQWSVCTSPPSHKIVCYRTKCLDSWRRRGSYGWRLLWAPGVLARTDPCASPPSLSPRSPCKDRSLRSSLPRRAVRLQYFQRLAALRQGLPLRADRPQGLQRRAAPCQGLPWRTVCPQGLQQRAALRQGLPGRAGCPQGPPAMHRSSPRPPATC